MLMKRRNQGKFVVEDLTSLNECNYKISVESLLWEALGSFGKGFLCVGVFRSWEVACIFCEQFWEMNV
jgi:hypothetical protein